MENMKKFWEVIRKFPLIPRIIIYISCAVVCVLCAIFSSTSCGTATKVSINNKAENAHPTVSIETNSSQDINVNPNTNLSNSSNNGN